MSVEGPQIEQHSKKDVVDDNPLFGNESEENSTFRESYLVESILEKKNPSILKEQVIKKQEPQQEVCDKYYCPGGNFKRCGNIISISEICNECGFYIGNYPGNMNDLLMK